MNAFIGLTLRDVWLRVLLWIVGISALTLIVPFAFEGLYSSEQEREVLRQTLDNPALIAMIGPVPEGAYTIAVMFSHEMLVFMAIIHGLFGIMIANAASRRMEDQGLVEYVNSAGITRQTIFMTQLLLGTGMNVLLGIVIFLGTYLSPDDSFTLVGCTLYAAGTSLFGLMFYTLTLVFAQLLPSSEWTFGMALAILLLLYLYRAITDVVSPEMSVVSPYNWLTRLEPFASNEAVWLLPFLLIVVLIGLAWVLFSRRDLGDAYFSMNLNKKPRTIGSYPRLMIGSMKVLTASWLIGMMLIGASYGSIFGDLDAFINENAFLADSMAASGEDPIGQFISVLIMITSVIGVIPALMVSGRILREEKHGRLEWLESAGMRRTRMLLGHGLYAIIVGFAGILIALLGMYGASMTVEGIDMTAGDYVIAAINYSAGVVLFVGLSMLLIGLRARLHFVVWFYLLFTFFINYLGLILGLDDAWLLATPFHHLAAMPSEEMAWTPWLAILGIGIVLSGAGVMLFRRRDVG
ncbi:ABC transporter permease [Salinicoccus hispanicus]|uniref:ABC transporter n=1 Tax=Salinicoccus hispanicus TaxID=157225 RepID=A0A6N8U5K9_9STAP|nr:ABC transporter [Salinicoccus hispanicus]MXQ50889.1 ABC transporter [Salinicoccus hispanicus]